MRIINISPDVASKSKRFITEHLTAGESRLLNPPSKPGSAAYRPPEYINGDSKARRNSKIEAERQTTQHRLRLSGPIVL